jgi:hypothetical protein
MAVMNKKGGKIKKSNGSILVTFIVIIIACFVVGFVVGILSKMFEDGGVQEEIIAVIKNFISTSLPITFIIVSVLAILVPLVAYAKCNAMYKKLKTDMENDDLWDALEHKLNQPIILSNVFSMIDLCLFFCLPLFGIAGVRDGVEFSEIIIVGFVLSVIASIVDILITKLTLDIEKNLNPQKEGNVLDLQFSKIWMSSCDEAERLIAYKAGYKAWSSTNATCITLIVVAFVCSVAFKTDALGMVFVFVIWFVNNLSYMLRAAKLEKGK